MNSQVVPSEPLTQVTFVHDYIQLVFQDEGFSLHNAVEVEAAGSRLAQGADGFADSLVRLVGFRVVSASECEFGPLQLCFEGGTKVTVTWKGAGPEAFEFSQGGIVTMVGQNV